MKLVLFNWMKNGISFESCFRKTTLSSKAAATSNTHQISLQTMLVEFRHGTIHLHVQFSNCLSLTHTKTLRWHETKCHAFRSNSLGFGSISFALSLPLIFFYSVRMSGAVLLLAMYLQFRIYIYRGKLFGQLLVVFVESFCSVR